MIRSRRLPFFLFHAGILAAALAFPLKADESPLVTLKVDWPSFMACQDPVWQRMPTNYFEGPFVGNGLLGAILFQDKSEPNTLRFEIGRTDVYDHRTNTGSVMHYGCRLPIGHLLLNPVGKITDAAFRTDLWNAEITGQITTDRGSIKLRCFTPSDAEIVVTQLSVTGLEKEAKISFVPEQGNSPRYIAQPNRDKNLNYVPNPPFQLKQVKDTELCVQPLLAGSDYATAWKQVAEATGNRTVYLAVANRKSCTGSEVDAMEMVKKAMARGIPELEKSHRAWWHSFYQASFVTLPDARIESFYWIQLYKMASATRENLPVVDLMGPWFKPTVWASYWQNLNTQLAYYSVLPANHPELGENICRLLWDRREDLINNVPHEYRSDSAALGNPTGFGNLVAPGPGPVREKLGKGSYHYIALPWLMQQYWLQYRFTMDDGRLRNEIYPLLKRTINTYLHTIDLQSDGRYHIPMAFSDEYGNAEDTNLNLAMLRWGLQTLLIVNSKLKLNDPDAVHWKEVLAKLTDYPVDEMGLMLGKDTPFAKPHRHSSHLFAIFPFHVLNIDDQPDQKPLMQKSIAHFLSFNGDDCMFKFTGASSLYAALGYGDQALANLQRALEPQPTGPTVAANTLYSENGWPTFESPISAQRAILDMLLQSWGDKIRVFPAIPTQWNETSFYHLRAEGAFLVSAKRSGGKTLFVGVKSLAGGPCRIKTDMAEPIVVTGISASAVRRVDGLLEIDLKKGEEVFLHSQGTNPPFLIAPVANQSGRPNAWGAKKAL
ncbi:MAG: glycoside hydrolase family 95-like protein [bacterium]